ncbi:MAG: MerR family transcriptional regulator [Janthinobacterium lividum]
MSQLPNTERAGKPLLSVLPPIPAKRYFTIGEVSELCGVKAHVLRYWEQEFSQLKPVKRRGNRRYYQHHEVLLIRRIRELLYEQGFTISGARNKLDSRMGSAEEVADAAVSASENAVPGEVREIHVAHPEDVAARHVLQAVRTELHEILALLRS